MAAGALVPITGPSTRGDPTGRTDPVRRPLPCLHGPARRRARRDPPRDPSRAAAPRVPERAAVRFLSCARRPLAWLRYPRGSPGARGPRGWRHGASGLPALQNPWHPAPGRGARPVAETFREGLPQAVRHAPNRGRPAPRGSPHHPVSRPGPIPYNPGPRDSRPRHAMGWVHSAVLWVPRGGRRGSREGMLDRFAGASRTSPLRGLRRPGRARRPTSPPRGAASPAHRHPCSIDSRNWHTHNTDRRPSPERCPSRPVAVKRNPSRLPPLRRRCR